MNLRYDDLLDWSAAAQHVRKQHGIMDFTETLLHSRHRNGSGPPVVKPNQRCVMFRRCDLDRWVESWKVVS